MSRSLRLTLPGRCSWEVERSNTMATWINRDSVFARAALLALIAACVLLMSAAGLFSQAAPAPPPQRTSFKFDFGPGKAPEGYTKVPADCLYSDQTGYGFDFGTRRSEEP